MRRRLSGAVHHRAEAHPEEQAGRVPDCGHCVLAEAHHQIFKAGETARSLFPARSLCQTAEVAVPERLCSGVLHRAVKLSGLGKNSRLQLLRKTSIKLGAVEAGQECDQ